MKKAFWLIVIVLGTFVCPVAAEETLVPEITATLSTKVWSKYLGANGGVSHDGAVSQTDLFITLPKGFYVDFWHSTGLDDFPRLSSNGGDEIDYTIGWAGKINRFGLDVGVAYYDVVELFHSRGDVIAPYVETNLSFNVFEKQTLTPFARIEMNLPVSGGESKSGAYVYGGLKHSWQLTPRTSISQKCALMYDSGAFGVKSGLVGQYQGELSYKISKLLSVEPLAIKLRTPVTSMSDGRKTEIAVGAGVTFRF